MRVGDCLSKRVNRDGKGIRENNPTSKTHRRLIMFEHTVKSGNTTDSAKKHYFLF